MTEEQLKNLEWKNANEELPIVSHNQTIVFIETAGGAKSKAMFYYNGGKPTFASYGSIIEDVVRWAYANK